MAPADIDNRFDYHAPDEGRREQHELIRQVSKAAAQKFDTYLPEGREKSLAITNLEQAMFWANAAIARS